MKMNLAKKLTVALTLAASCATAAANFDQAKAASDRGDYAKALELFESCKSQPDCSFEYGLMARLGWGMPINDELAFRHIEQSAKQGYADAYHLTGVLYYDGRGTKKDFEKAAEWFKKGADNRNEFSAYLLGDMSEKGIGTEKDFKAALDWFTRATDYGHKDGLYRIGLLYQKGGPNLKSEFEPAILAWCLAAQKGHTKAKETLKETFSEHPIIEVNLPSLTMYEDFRPGSTITQIMKKGDRVNIIMLKDDVREVFAFDTQTYKFGFVDKQGLSVKKD